tara:strand:- start:422 stop:553 length:132 start_codon:yes stop_codon:yes gene_type:complete
VGAVDLLLLLQLEVQVVEEEVMVDLQLVALLEQHVKVIVVELD